jgi:hypothetical protein
MATANSLRNVVVRFKDPRRGSWKVREAVSMRAAFEAMSIASATGSVGSSTVRGVVNPTTLRLDHEVVLADVVRLNDDGSERTPS